MNRVERNDIDPTQVSAGKIACFGKLPGHGDFVRHNASGEAMEAFDDWISETVYAARMKIGSGFDDVMAAAPCFRFLFRTSDSIAPLVGLLYASQDRSGRRYPFVVAVELQDAFPPYSELPSRVTPLLDSLDSRAAPVVRGEGTFDELVDNLAGVPHGLPLHPDESFGAFLAQPAGSFWRSLYGSFEDSHKYFLVKNLLDIFQTNEERFFQDVTYGLRWPSFSEDSEAAACTAFWIALCEQVAHASWARGSAFWRPSSSALFFRTPPVTALRDLLLDDADSESMFSIDHSGGENAVMAALSIPPRQGEVLEAEDVALNEWLASFRR